MFEVKSWKALTAAAVLAMAGSAASAVPVTLTFDFAAGGNQEGYLLSFLSSPAGVGLDVTGHLYTAPDTINAQAKVYNQNQNGLGVCGNVILPSTRGCSSDKQLDGGAGADDNELLKFTFNKLVSLVSIEFNQNDQNDIFDFFVGEPLDFQWATNTPLPPNRTYTFNPAQSLSVFGIGIRGNSDEVRIAKLTVSYEPATVPVPAAGFLLIGALGGLGIVSRRQRKAA